MFRLVKYLSGIALGLTIAVVGLSQTAGAADFYRGKTLSTVISGSAGGNTNLQARTFMRFMKKHIPGRPRVVNRNMGGSGGLLATNFVGEVAPKDGTTVWVGTMSFISQLVEDPALRVKFTEFAVVGGIGQQGVVHIRKDTPPGISGPADLFKVTAPFKTAGYRPGHSVDLHLGLTLSMLGIKHKHVTGFRSSSKMHKAELQNEIQMGFDSTAGFRRRVTPVLIKPGISVPLWHAGVPTENGDLEASPNFTDLPTFLDVYRMKYGKNATPKGLKWDSYLLITGLRSRLLRAILLPPGSPKAAITTLRTAWAKTVKDPEFVKTYIKLNKGKPFVTLGEEGQRYLARTAREADPKVIAYLKSFKSKKKKR
jgi:tripartite-type tricarboxylate transporter receptor subunit TctC